MMLERGGETKGDGREKEVSYICQTAQNIQSQEGRSNVGEERQRMMRGKERMV